MKKPPLQDVIVKNPDYVRRNVYRREERTQPVDVEGKNVARDIQYSAPSRKREEVEYDERNEYYEPRKKGFMYEGSRTNKKWLYTALGVGLVVVLSSAGLSLLFAGATVTVYPKQDTVVVNATFNAYASDTAEKDKGMSIERMVLERTAKKEVIAQGEENVEERASGKITIFNEYSDTPQRLIKNTRFKSDDGHIYRIHESIEIPGKAVNDTAGSVDVMVYAEESGEDYNLTGPQTFSIPGFEGLPQEKLVYAKSTDTIAGGFKGLRRTVSEEDRTKSIGELETQLRDELLSTAFTNSDKPEGFYLFKEAVFFEFTTLADEVTDDGKVILSLSGKLHGILFNEDAFAQYVARTTLSAYTDTPIRIDNLEELSVTVTPTTETTNAVLSESEYDSSSNKTSSDTTNASVLPWQAVGYNVLVQGKAHFIWEFDEKTLVVDLTGKEKDVLNPSINAGIIEKYSGIDRLEVSVRPFWKSTFPDETKDIIIITELDD